MIENAASGPKTCRISTTLSVDGEPASLMNAWRIKSKIWLIGVLHLLRLLGRARLSQSMTNCRDRQSGWYAAFYKMRVSYIFWKGRHKLALLWQNIFCCPNLPFAVGTSDCHHGDGKCADDGSTNGWQGR
ncbi:hypothetical protein, partial [Agrobacterium leguminum]|uniref:hypothetical protein n=1 Tax=Agrobacterium leguminum TaxID=2792015 RepID=UPI0019D61754